MAKEDKKESLLKRLGESQVWKSIIRSGVPQSRRQRMYAVLGNVLNWLYLVYGRVDFLLIRGIDNYGHSAHVLLSAYS